MDESEFVVLDTRAFDSAIAKRADLINAYNEINSEYDEIIKKLLKSWKGKGATAFKNDASIVKKNIVGVFDILKTMCDTLEDCRKVFSECDKSLGDYNRENSQQA